jgi:hypothetical protein
MERLCYSRILWTDFLTVSEICSLQLCNASIYKNIRDAVITRLVWTSQLARKLLPLQQKNVRCMHVDDKGAMAFKHQITVCLPQSICKYSALLYLKCELASLNSTQCPQSLTHLVFGDLFHTPDFAQVMLPCSLLTLEFGCSFNASSVAYPPSLTKLTYGTNFNQRLLNLPTSLTELALGAKYTQRLQFDLPCKLKKLTLHGCYSHVIDTVPSSFQELIVFGQFQVNTPSRQQISPFSTNLRRLQLGAALQLPTSCLNGVRVIHVAPSLFMLTKLSNPTANPFTLSAHLTDNVTKRTIFELFKCLVPHLISHEK